MVARRIRGLVPLPALALGLVLLPIAHEATTRNPAEAAYRSLPPQPTGDPARGAAGVERTALDLAAWLRAVPLHAASKDPCPSDDLQVSWSPPSPAAGYGAYVAPLGPAPTDATTAVNGIVVCTGSDYGYMGFQARYVNGRWDVVGVPTQDDDAAAVPVPDPVPSAAAPVPVTTLDGRTFGPAIEDPAAYEPQRTCDATAKVGALAIKNLLLETHPGSRSLGIGTACDGTVSEHHEGRAFDWGVRVTVPAEKAMAEAFIDKVLATDQYGNQFALARRMGIMYMIWDNHIWGAYRASEGWREYHGASPHTDHIHISMSWAGALGRTSFWSGNVAQVLSALSPLPGGGGGSQSAATPKPEPRTQSPPSNEGRDATIDTQLAADRDARRAAREQARRDWQAQQAALQAARDEARRQAALTTTTTSTTVRPTTTTVRPTRTTTTTSTTVRATTTTVKPTTTTTTARATTTTSTTARASTTTTTVHATTSTTSAPH